MIILTFDFGSIYGWIVMSLTTWTQRALEKPYIFLLQYLTLSYCVRRTNSKKLYWVSLMDFYVGQLLFVDRGWQNVDLMSTHHFWILSGFPPSSFREDKYLVNFDACECLSGYVRSVHFTRLTLICSEDKESFLMCWMIFLFQGSQCFLCAQLWSNQLYFQYLLKVTIWLLKHWHLLCFWHPYFQLFIRSMW